MNLCSPEKRTEKGQKDKAEFFIPNGLKKGQISRFVLLKDKLVTLVIASPPSQARDLP